MVVLSAALLVCARTVVTPSDSSNSCLRLVAAASRSTFSCSRRATSSALISCSSSRFPSAPMRESSNTARPSRGVRPLRLLSVVLTLDAVLQPLYDVAQVADALVRDPGCALGHLRFPVELVLGLLLVLVWGLLGWVCAARTWWALFPATRMPGRLTLRPSGAGGRRAGLHAGRPG